MDTLIKYLPYLIQLGQSIPRIMQFVEDMKANYESKGEWTPEMDAMFTSELEKWTPEI